MKTIPYIYIYIYIYIYFTTYVVEISSRSLIVKVIISNKYILIWIFCSDRKKKKNKMEEWRKTCRKFFPQQICLYRITTMKTRSQSMLKLSVICIIQYELFSIVSYFKCKKCVRNIKSDAYRESIFYHHTICVLIATLKKTFMINEMHEISEYVIWMIIEI